MLPGEMVILIAVTMNKHTGRKLSSGPLDITSEYIGFLYNSLVKRGYIKGHPTTGFRLTALGEEVIRTFVRKNRSKDLDIVERLRLLGIELSPEQEGQILAAEKETVNID
ncbi:MAG: hypothetical protein PVG61_07710 [Dehalococcoidia bacterium]|jgi:hypothetical protein